MAALFTEEAVLILQFYIKEIKNDIQRCTSETSSYLIICCKQKKTSVRIEVSLLKTHYQTLQDRKTHYRNPHTRISPGFKDSIF